MCVYDWFDPMLTRVAPLSEAILIDRFRPAPTETFKFVDALPVLAAGDVTRMLRSAQPSLRNPVGAQ